MIWRVSVCTPMIDGVKLIETAQLAEAASDAPQVLDVIEYCVPLARATLLIVSEVVPALVSVTLKLAEVTFFCCCFQTRLPVERSGHLVFDP